MKTEVCIEPIRRFANIPVVIEAEQFDGTEASAARVSSLFPGLVHPASDDGVTWNGKLVVMVPDAAGEPDGWMMVEPMDWVMRGPKGEVHPVHPDVFAGAFREIPVDAVIGQDVRQPIGAGGR
jgi:hypothetical protein